MTYEERYADQFLDSGWRTASQLLVRLLSMMQVTRVCDLLFVTQHMRATILKPLIRCESLVRRLLVFAACKLDPPRRPHVTSTARKTRPIAPAVTSRLPGFRLTEPWPSTTPFQQRRPIARPLPRISVMDADGFLVSSSRVGHRIIADPSAKMLRRLTALQAVIEDPLKSVWRMAGWLARRGRSRRNSPLKIGIPPGRLKAKDRRHGEDIIDDAQHHARYALERLDSS